MFPKQMPSFIALSRKTVSSLGSDPSTCNLKTIIDRNGQAKRSAYRNLGRHERCFESPDSTKKLTTVRSATASTRNSNYAKSLPRSKSTDTATTFLAESATRPKTERSRTLRTSRIQNGGRRNLSSPPRVQSKPRPHSKSPVAFGRSVSKERTFAEEKKRLENTLPPSQMNFQSCTNILRDPTLKSPDEVRHAMRSFALRTVQNRSKSFPRYRSPLRCPRIQFSTTTIRCSSFPRPSIATLAEYRKSLQTPSNNIQETAFKSNPSPKIIENQMKQPKREIVKKSTRNHICNISKSSSMTSLVRTNSTFSVDSIQSKFINTKSSLKKSTPLIPDRATVRDVKESARTKLLGLADQQLLSSGQNMVTRTSISDALKRNPRGRKYSRSKCDVADSPANNLRQSRMPDRSLPTPPSTLIRKSTVGGSPPKLPLRMDKTYPETKEICGRSLKKIPTPDFSEIGDNLNTRAERTEEIIWRLDQRSGIGMTRKLSPPPVVNDIARPISPSPQRSRQEFLPTKEVRVPQVEREVRSPSRRRIEGLRPKGKTDSIVRTNSLGSRNERSNRSGLYVCGDLSQSATSLDYHERHGQTCPYRVRSERFIELNRFYNILERVGQLERATLAENIKPIRKEGEKLDFDKWRQVRFHERAEKELNYLIEKLIRDQREKDLLFRPKDMEESKWSEIKDFGLHLKEKSVEDLRGRFERIIHEDYCEEPKKRNLDYMKDFCNPFWRNNTVADIASSLEVKYDPKIGIFGMQQKPRSSSSSVSALLGELQNKTRNLFPKDDRLSMPQYPARADVSEEYVITVNADSKPRPEMTNLKIRCNSALTERDLIDSVRGRKMCFEEEECLKPSLKKEAQGEETVYSKTCKIPLPPPMPQNPLNKSSGNVVSTQDRVAPSNEATANVKLSAEDIHKKIQYFEERKFNKPPKTVYLAREDSSPDEDGNVRQAKDELKTWSSRPIYHHKDLTSSLTDLREMYGEKQSTRQNFPSRPPPPKPPDQSAVPIISFNGFDQKEKFHETSRYRTETTENVAPSSYSRSASPASQASSYLTRIHTGEVKKLKDQFESFQHQWKKNEHLKRNILRKVHSDSEINPNTNLSSGDRKGDVSWLTHKFELWNDCSKSLCERRSTPKKILSPHSRKDRFMPHIDVISKSALLKRDMAYISKSPSPCRSERGERVKRTRSIYEKFSQHVSLESAKKSRSNPDIRDWDNISPHLKALWIAHKYPSPTDNSLSDVRTFRECKNQRKSRNNCLKTPKSSQSTAAKLSKSSKVVELDALEKPSYSIVKPAETSKNKDFFANQNFDPSKHRPKARYIPGVPGDEFNCFKDSKRYSSHLARHKGPTGAVVVKFKDVAQTASPPSPEKAHCIEKNGQPSESPNRYIESDVNIHYKTPIRYEYKEPIAEEELAMRQAEQMQKLYQEERRRKYLQELQDMNSRRHADNFTPSQKSPIPLNRYEDFQADLAPKISSPAMSPRTVARALYSFQGQTARELTFRKGDVIYIRRKIDKNWYEGEHNAMIGLLPASYVEIISKDGIRQPLRKAAEGQARAKYNFQAQSGIELSLNKGELVTLTRRVDDNWFEGKIANRKGIFPVSYVEVLSDIGSKDYSTPRTVTNQRPSLEALRASINDELNAITQNGHHTPNGILRETRNTPTTDMLHVDTSSNPLTFRALYKYRPQNSDELELQEGDIIHVLEKCDDGWFVGTSQRTGYFGTFPGNYVERV